MISSLLTASREAIRVRHYSLSMEQELMQGLANFAGRHWLLAAQLLLYASGLRLVARLVLRVKDVELGCGCVAVWSGEGAKDRVVANST